MKDMMKKILQYPLLVLSVLFLVVFTLVDLLTPTRYFSDLENTYLAQKPDFSWEALFNNSYTQNYETYVNQQFAGRDQWIDLKSRAEFLLAKTENNGVIYGKDDYMFEKINKLNDKQINLNLDSINQFAEKYGLPVTFGLIPNAYEVLEDKLPVGAVLLDQEKLIADFYAQTPNLQHIDFLPNLEAHKDEYIYYRTDHHWTTLGAYYGYQSIMDLFQMKAHSLEQFTSHTVSDFYGTFFSKAKSFNAVPDEITYYDIPTDLEIYGGEAHDSFYDLSKFETRDKYGAFMYGNQALTIVRNPEASDASKRLLLIKDSYSNSLIPYLSLNYGEIYVVDLRYTAMISAVMGMAEFDEALVLYNFSSFITDTDIPRLKY